MEFCDICEKDVTTYFRVRVSKKGLLSLLHASLARKDDRLEEYFRRS